MRKGSGFWLRNKGFARFMSVFVSVTMVLSLLPSAGVEEARNELLMATAVAQETEGTNSTTDPGGGSNNASAGSTTEGQSANGTDASKDAGASSTTPDNSGSSSTNNNQEATEGTDETKPNSDSQNTEGNSTDEQNQDESNQGEQKSEDQNKPEDQTKVDETPRSANLADFITEAEVEGVEQKDGKLNVNEGEPYIVRLTFAERGDKQFSNEGELTFALPQGFTPEGEQPASHDALVITYADDNGERQNIELGKDSWWIDGTTIHMVWKVRDAETRSEEEVAKALDTIYSLTDIEFVLNVAGTFAAGTESVAFGAPTEPIALSVTPAPKEEGKKDASSTTEEQKKGEEENTDANKYATTTNGDATKSGDATGKDETKDKDLMSTIANANKLNSANDQGVVTPKTIWTRGVAAAQALTPQATDDPKDLSNFITAVSISAPKDANGAYVVKEDKPYSIHLSFAEDPKGMQFDDNGPLTYQLPAGIGADGQNGNMQITITTDTNTYVLPNNAYSISGNTLTVDWDKTNADNYNALKSASNVNFTVSFDGVFSNQNQHIVFPGGIEKDVIVDRTNNVTVSKTGSVEKWQDKLKYTVSVVSTGNSTNVVLSDTLEGTGLTLDRDNFQASSSTGQTVSATLGGSGNQFTYALGNMSDGEVITVTYYAKISPEVLSRLKDDEGKIVTTARNSVKVVSRDDPDNPPVRVENEIDYTPTVNKNGKIVGTNENGDKIIEYTVTYNPDAKVAISGTGITDTIKQSSQSHMSYIGDVTVQKYANGSNEPASTSTFSADGQKTWTYDIQDTTPYRYVFTYRAKVDKTAFQSADFSADNDVNVEPGPDTGSHITIPTDKTHPEISKSVDEVDVANKEITWTATIVVPQGEDLTEAKVTDTYPVADKWVNGEHLTWIESVKGTAAQPTKNDVTVTGLLSDEDYTVDFNANGGKEAVITFTKNGAQGLHGGTNGSRIITVTFKTKIDPDWLDTSRTDANYRTHVNSINFSGITETKTATATITAPTVKKTATQVGTRNVGGVDLPIYMFKVELAGVHSDVNEVKDVFDTDLLEVYNDGGDQYQNNFWIYVGNQYSPYYPESNTGDTSWTTGTPASYISFKDSDTQKGIKIYTSSESLKKGYESYNGGDPNSYYPVYGIVYYLTVKDANALNTIMGHAANNNGKYDITNTAEWEGDTKTGKVTFEYPGLKKEIVSVNGDAYTNTGQLTVTDKDVKPRFRLTLNPAGALLNNGNPVTVTDTVDNLSVDISSVRAVPDDGLLSYEMSGNVVTYTIQDATKVVIEYDAKVLFPTNGEVGDTVAVNFKNVAEMEGYHDQVNETAKRTNNGSGEGSVPSINIIYKGLRVR